MGVRRGRTEWSIRGDAAGAWSQGKVGIILGVVGLVVGVTFLLYRAS